MICFYILLCTILNLKKSTGVKDDDLIQDKEQGAVESDYSIKKSSSRVVTVILCVIFPIAQLVFLFWPGKETTVNPIKKASKSGNFSIRKEPTLFKS